MNLNKLDNKPISKFGNLHTLPAYYVLYKLAQQKKTGKIIFENKQRIKHIFIKDGQINAIYSNLIDESFKNILLKKNLVPKKKIIQINQQLDEIELFRQESIESYHDQAKYLLNINQVKMNALEEKFSHELLLDLLGWFQGKYLFVENENKHQHQTSINILIILSSLENYFYNSSLSLDLFDNSITNTQKFDDQAVHNSNIFSTSTKHNIAFFTISTLLNLASKHSFTGNLKLSKDTFNKEVHFQNGHITNIVSNKKNEHLFTSINRWHGLNEKDNDQINNYLADADFTDDKKFMDMLLSLQRFDIEQLQFFKNICHFEKFLQLFHWKTGYFTFTSEKKNISYNHNKASQKSITNKASEKNLTHNKTYLLHNQTETNLLKLLYNTPVVLLKKNLNMFKFICANINVSCFESTHQNSEDKTDWVPLSKDESSFMHYFVFENIKLYQSLPKNMLLIVNEGAKTHELQNIHTALIRNNIKISGFFTV